MKVLSLTILAEDADKENNNQKKIAVLSKWSFVNRWITVNRRITVNWQFTSINQWFTLVKYLIPGLQLFFSITLLDTVDGNTFLSNFFL